MKLKHLIFGLFAIGLISCGTQTLEQRFDTAIDNFEKACQKGDCEKAYKAVQEIKELKKMGETDEEDEMIEKKLIIVSDILDDYEDFLEGCEEVWKAQGKN